MAHPIRVLVTLARRSRCQWSGIAFGSAPTPPKKCGPNSLGQRSFVFYGRSFEASDQVTSSLLPPDARELPIVNGHMARISPRFPYQQSRALTNSEDRVSMHAHIPRNFNLDALRGIAIMLVVLFHLDVPVFRTGGWIGVDLFFVLSGFLISGLLFREWTTTGTINIPRFYIRRGFKIYPPFYVLLAVTVAVNLVAPGIPSFPVTVRTAFAEATFTQNYFQGIWGQTWSLAVEEHFYLLLPVVLWFLQRRNDNNPFRLMPTLFMVVATVELCCASQQREACQPTRQQACSQHTCDSTASCSEYFLATTIILSRPKLLNMRKEE